MATSGENPPGSATLLLGTPPYVPKKKRSLAYRSQVTNKLELKFRAVLTEGTREVCFERGGHMLR
jgi:hypothetical protein